MRLSQLLAPYISISENDDCEITHLCLSSRDVKPGALFFAYPGEKTDGRNYIDDAIKKGAVAIIAECRGGSCARPVQMGNHKGLPLPPTVIYLKDVQHKIGPIAQQFYNNPAKNMQIIGVTGTSGKTSVTNIIAQILNLLGKKAYVMGTFGVGKPEGPFIETGINTPDPISLQQYLSLLQQQGCEVLVMEVSSHALMQGRTQGLVFDAALFLNLTQDHLDYHKTMQAYGLAKERLLTEHSVKHAVFNLDDPWSLDLYQRYKETEIICRGFSKAQTIPSNQLVGEFNRQNLLAAVTCLLLLGYDERKVMQALPQVRPIPGRLESVHVPGAPCCVIDYAHKPDALEKALIAVRQMTPGQLFCVFGCGGDRDKGKRPLMAQIAENYADEVCITEDNPRTENSQTILEDILSGFKDKEKVRVVPDRAEAIRSTIARAKEGDVILIAGKGHEDYQIIGHEKKYFSDKEIVVGATGGRPL